MSQFLLKEVFGLKLDEHVMQPCIVQSQDK